MTRPRSPSQELEAALTVLGEVSQVGEADEPEHERIAPPPLPDGSKKDHAGDFAGRREFPDLFAAETLKGDTRKLSPEEKVDFFRQKLRHAEDQIAAFKVAWTTRNRELDHLEALLDTERLEKSHSMRRLKQLESFLDDKRNELESYALRVAETFAEQEEKESSLREQLVAANAETQRLHDQAELSHRSREESEKARNELESTVAALESEERELRDSLEDAQREVTSLRLRLSEREGQLNETRDDAEETEARLRTAAANREEELQAKLAELRDQLRGHEGQIEPLREELASSRERAKAAEADATSKHNQLIARDELIQHYREEAERAKAELENSSARTSPPPIPTETLSTVSEMINAAGKQLSLILRGDGPADPAKLRIVMKRLKAARAAVDEVLE